MDIHQTEEGLQMVLARLAEARGAGDDAAVGRALLELAELVKWVRSDNQESPFDRLHTLALEALEIFRRIGDRRGEISAMLLAAPFEPRESALEMLLKAQELAEESGDAAELARVLAGRARQIGLRDRGQAKEMTTQALEIYRGLGKIRGMARCHFSLSIYADSSEDKRANALEAARLYREVGDRNQAGKSVVLALYSADDAEITALEPEIGLALADAQSACDRGTEGRCYRFLAQIAEARGDAESAEKYRRWENQLKDPEPDNTEMFEIMIAITNRTGNSEMAELFEAQLQRSKQGEQ